MKKIYTVLAIAVTGFAFAQSTGKIGVNTSTPTATLDIQPTTANAATSATTVEGVLVPRVSRLRAANMGTAVPESTLVYVNSITDGSLAGTTVNVNETGFYYFKGGVWTKVGGAGGAATPEGTFTRNIRSDNRLTVVVDQAQDGITAVNDYFIRLVATTNNITFPTPSTSNVGRTLCLYNEGTGNGIITPQPVGPAQTVQASQVACFISDGTNWINSNGY